MQATAHATARTTVHPTARASMPPSALGSDATLAVTWTELSAERSYLVQFARRRLLDPALAEDLVHDVFEAVATGRALFNGRSSLRSWLVAILKHKIVDLVRQRVGHDSLDTCASDDGDDEGSGEHRALLCPQPQPDEIAEQRQLLAHTLARISSLPTNLRQVVELRLLRERSSAEVCRALAISSQNLFVRLHRARRLLAA